MECSCCCCLKFFVERMKYFENLDLVHAWEMERTLVDSGKGLARTWVRICQSQSHS